MTHPSDWQEIETPFETKVLAPGTITLEHVRTGERLMATPEPDNTWVVSGSVGGGMPIRWERLVKVVAETMAWHGCDHIEEAWTDGMMNRPYFRIARSGKGFDRESIYTPQRGGLRSPNDFFGQKKPTRQTKK